MDALDLRDLHAFAAVARLRSFRRAAAEQRVSVSGLSQRVRDLEERLGVRLLNRTTRSVAPTQAGDALLGRLAPALQDVADAVGVVRGLRDVPSGRLRINAPAPAAQLVLAPMVAPFLKRNPAIDLEIVVEPHLIDIVAGGFDAGVRLEEHLAKDMIAVSLGPPERYVVVAAPSTLAAHGRPAKPKDLLERPCISTAFPNRVALPWEFERGGRVIRIVPKGSLTSSGSGADPARGDRRPGLPDDVRRLRPRRHRRRQAGLGARGLVPELPRTLPLLSEPPAAAARAARVRIVREGLARRRQSNGKEAVRPQNNPTILPSVPTSIESAAGTRGRPGMVMISPQIATTNSAPAESRTSRTLMVWSLGAPLVSALVEKLYWVLAMQTGSLP